MTPHQEKFIIERAANRIMDSTKVHDMLHNVPNLNTIAKAIEVDARESIKTDLQAGLILFSAAARLHERISEVYSREAEERMPGPDLAARMDRRELSNIIRSVRRFERKAAEQSRLSAHDRELARPRLVKTS